MSVLAMLWRALAVCAAVVVVLIVVLSHFDTFPGAEGPYRAREAERCVCRVVKP
jgi:hypothetical protein